MEDEKECVDDGTVEENKVVEHQPENEGEESPPPSRNKSKPSDSFFLSLKQLPLFNDEPKSPMESSCSSSTISGPEFVRSNVDNPLEVVRSYHEKRETKGTIKLNISNVSGLKTKVMSSFYMIANLPWRLAAKTENSKRTNNTKFFSIYIDCNPESDSTLWNCEAVVEFRLLAQNKESGQDFTRHFTNTFSFNSNNWGFPSFIEFNEIIDPEKGFIKNDKVVIEAHILVRNVAGVSRVPSFDFLTHSNAMSDGILIIEGTKLFISKQYLALYSPYLALYSPVFEAMFYSNFAERDKKEINIEDVLLEEFLELLHVIYPSHKPVSVENVEYLLELGDKFQIQYVMDQCESFLEATEMISVATKLVWADQYALSRLQHSCIKTMTKPSDIKALKATDEYRKLSDTTRAALLEKMFKVL
uniref:BTB domain-containing protein n=1 Tax=Panagrolaimus sp. JU765 TaxID=591449 RepID=A0AC34RPW0_9BILA